MSKYNINVTFDNNTGNNDLDSNEKTIYINLLDSNNSLKYGFQNIITKFIKHNIYPTEIGIDLLCLASVVYLADIQISRELHSENSWTREIKINLPVSNIELWNKAKDRLNRMLSFLTGDLWSISFSSRCFSLSEENKDNKSNTYDTVSLFSGGMDSLIGTINNLENKRNTALISHASEPFTKSAQTQIVSKLYDKYGKDTFSYFDLWTCYNKNTIIDGGEENTTRSRSFLFISLGVCAITGIPKTNILQVPENALISLNVPLDDLRIGSHSTRTTHPFYFQLWNELLSNLNTDILIENPYWNKTKGEMASECINKDFLCKTIKESMSCSSMNKLRFKGISPQHCGYCVPCLIRQAAMSKAFGFGNDPTKYYASIKDIRNKHNTNEGVQLRSFEYAISKVKNNKSKAFALIHKSGPLRNDYNYLQELASVYYRGLMEVDSFIQEALKVNDD